MRTKHQNDTLIVYLKQPSDWKIIEKYGIYRIRSWIKNPPEILENRSVKTIAFYLPSIFGKKKYSIRHYAKVNKISIAPRYECCPDEPENKRSNAKYYKIDIEEPQRLQEPIFHFRAAKKKLSRREMILFPTTSEKLHTAKEFNFLFNGSSLEEKMWDALIENGIYPEREWPVKINKERHYYLDFAIFCQEGKFCIEIDGEQHLEKKQVLYDNDRTNHTNIKGWKTYRFYEKDLKSDTITGTINQVTEAIQERYGLDTEKGLFPDAVPSESSSPQLAMFTDTHLDFLNLRNRIKERFEKE